MTKNKKEAEEIGKEYPEDMDCCGDCDNCKFIDYCDPQLKRIEALENPDVLPFKGEDIRQIANYFDDIDALQERLSDEDHSMQDIAEEYPDHFLLLQKLSEMYLYLQLAYRNSMDLMGLINPENEDNFDDEDDDFSEDLD